MIYFTKKTLFIILKNLIFFHFITQGYCFYPFSLFIKIISRTFIEAN